MTAMHRDGLAGVIFDMDGTVSDTWAVSLSSFRTAIDRLAPRPYTDKELMAFAGPAEEGIFERLLPDHWEACFELYIKTYASRITLQEALFDGLGEVLDHLRSRRVLLAIVSGKSLRAVEITLERADITDRFEIVKAGSPEGDVKSKNIQLILDAWGFDPRRVAYVGDAIADINAAHAAGVIAAGAAWSETARIDDLRRVGADVVFSQVDDFFRWLKANTQ